MDEQLDLFDRPPGPIPVADPNVPEIERARLSRQSRAVLEYLREHGKATNMQLLVVASRFGARILDLRRAGYSIEIIGQDRRTGLVVYEYRGGPHG